MGSVFSTLQYLRLKILISLIRVLIRSSSPRIRTNPDAVLRIPSRDAGRTITAHLYNPPPKPSSSSSGSGNNGRRSPPPVLLNLYGSAFALPLFGADEGYCKEMAKRTGHAVLDVEYRLAPEAAFPGPNHDVEDAVRYVLSHPELYDSTRMSVSGFSSGGTLALVAPMLFPPAANVTFRNVIAFYPSANLATDPKDRKPPVELPDGTPSGRGPALFTRLFREAYLRDMDPRDPAISPLFAQDLSKYAENLLVITGDYDSSALDAEKFAQKVESVGKRVIWKRMPKCIHAFDKKVGFEGARDESYQLAANMLLFSP
ncbi:putative carboxylesterase [Nemania serpens]|nr:putative carboxylesterase [Nemania serpens]